MTGGPWRRQPITPGSICVFADSDWQTSNCPACGPWDAAVSFLQKTAKNWGWKRREIVEGDVC